MSNVLIYAVPPVCVDIDSHARTICLPIKRRCDDTCYSFDLSPCGMGWNCNICQVEGVYFNPFISGDLIQFQTRFIDFVSADLENPDSGWGDWIFAELCDSEGNIISSDFTEFTSRTMVGWSGDFTYQIIEIDTSLAVFDGLDCWSVRIFSLDQSGMQAFEACTEPFQRVVCEDTMLIEGEFTSSHCCGIYYGDPVAFFGDGFAYNNGRRYWGFVLDNGTAVTKERFGDRVRDITISTLYLLKMDRLFPPYIKNQLLGVHLAAERVFVDGVEFRADSYSIENENRCGRMFFFDVGLTQECDLRPGCNQIFS